MLRKLSDGEFCSSEHRLLYLAEQERLALARLVEAQRRFAQEALEVTRASQLPQEVTAPMASFVWNGPWEQPGSSRVAGQVAPLPYKESIQLPRLEDTEVAAKPRRPSQLHRPRAAAASGVLAPARPSGVNPEPQEPIAPSLCAFPAWPACSIGPAAALKEPPLCELAMPTPKSAARKEPAATGFVQRPVECLLPEGRSCLEPTRLGTAGVVAPASAEYAASAMAWRGDLQILQAPLSEPVIPNLSERLRPTGLGAFAEIPESLDWVREITAGPVSYKLEGRIGSGELHAMDPHPECSTFQAVFPFLSAVSAGNAALSVADGFCAFETPVAADRPAAALLLHVAPQTAAPTECCLPSAASLPSGSLATAAPAALGLAVAAWGGIARAKAFPESLPLLTPTQLPPASGVSFAGVPPELAEGPQAALRLADPAPAAPEPTARVVEATALPLSAAQPLVPPVDQTMWGGAPAGCDEMVRLRCTLEPEDRAAPCQTIPTRLEWDLCPPAPPAFRGAVAPPACVAGEGPEVPARAGWGALPALARFWRSAPLEMRWAAAAVPLVFGLIWYAAGDRPQRGEDGRVQITSAYLPVGQFVKARWESVRQGIAERAGVELFDDFRSGLSAWEGGKNWAQSWSYDNAGFARTGSLALFTPSLGMADYDFEFLGRVEKKALNWVVRAQDIRNYQAVKILVTRPGPLPAISLVRYAVVDGKEGPHTRVSIPLTVANDTLYRVKTTVRGSSFTVSVQGLVVDTWNEDRLRRGGVGFFSPKGEQSLLRWVTVTHQYDTLGKLCAYLAPLSIPSRKGD